MTARPQAFRTFYDSDGSLRWRLLALNGRTLGVSIQGYPDTESAWHALAMAAKAVELLTPTYHHPDSRVGWMWTASDEQGNSVANGARAYERRATCVVGFERFLLTLREVADQV